MATAGPAESAPRAPAYPILSGQAPTDPAALASNLRPLDRAWTSLDAVNRLYLERRALWLRLLFTLGPVFMVMGYGPAIAPLALVVELAVVGSSAWIWLLVRKAPGVLLRFQLGLRLADIALAWMVLLTIRRFQPDQAGDHGYLFLVVFAAATHGIRGTLIVSGAATAAVLATRVIIAGALIPQTDFFYSLNYGLQFIAIGSIVAFLMRTSGQAVARRDTVWQAEMASRNAALQRMAEQLGDAIRELEAFAYSVSHDLRAPLRSIDGFSSVLEQQHADELDPQARDYLGRVRAATKRMGRLIDDLLALSRVTRSDLLLERVDLSAIARDIAEELQDREPGRDVTWLIDEHMLVSGDARLLRIGLENLLENAWKFTSREQVARIELRSEISESETIYTIRDNGVGFDMANADRLFGAFQRLHSTDEFEGTGIGLATVQRVVRRHGGRIWATSAPGQGATFYFTLSGPIRPVAEGTSE